MSDRASFLSDKLSKGGLPSEDLLNMADKAVTSGDVMKAQSMYAQLLAGDPDNIEYLLKLADLDRLIGKFELSIKAYDRVLELDPGNQAAVEGLGRLYLAKGELRKAVQAFSAVADVNPNRWQVFDGLGTAKALMADYPSSRDCFRKALELNPSSGRVLNNMALSEVLAGNLDLGIEMLRKASALANLGEKNRVKVELNLALAYALNQDLDSAQQVASQHLTGKELYNNMGVYAMLAKDKKVANAFLQKSLASSMSYYDKPWKNLDAVADK